MKKLKNLDRVNNLCVNGTFFGVFTGCNRFFKDIIRNFTLKSGEIFIFLYYAHSGQGRRVKSWF